MIDVAKEIGKNLKRLFPNLKLYRNNVEGGFEEPSFLLQKIQSTSAPLTFGNQNRTYYYQLVYFPNPSNIAADIDQVEATLLDYFTELEGFAQLVDRQSKINDQTLNFTFEVNIFAKVGREETKQAKMEYQGGINNG